MAARVSPLKPPVRGTWEGMFLFGLLLNGSILPSTFHQRDRVVQVHESKRRLVRSPYRLYIQHGDAASCHATLNNLQRFIFLVMMYCFVILEQCMCVATR